MADRRADGPLELYVACGLLIGLLGKAAMIAPLIANATRWFDRRRGLAVAIISSGQGFAGMLWPPIVRYMNDLVGWRGTYLYFGGLALVTMLPLACLLKPKPPAAPVNSGRAGDAWREERRDDGRASAGRTRCAGHRGRHRPSRAP